MALSESGVWKAAALIACIVLALVLFWAYRMLAPSLRPQVTPEPLQHVAIEPPALPLPLAPRTDRPAIPSGKAATRQGGEKLLCVGGVVVSVTDERGVKTFTQVVGAPPCG